MRTPHLSIVGVLSAACLAASPVVVTDWNAAAFDGLPHSKARYFMPRVMAMMEIAVFDAVNSIGPRYKPYAYSEKAPAGASDVAAASPPVDSPQALRDLVEVGAIGSVANTEDVEGLAIARFHERPGIFAWSDVARRMIVSHDLDLVDSARAMALAEIVISDTLSTGYGTKHYYNFWRSVTAVHAGGADFGHPEIAANADWKPRLATPHFPKYPCMHCAVGGAMAFVLERLFPDHPAFKVAVADRGERAFRDFRQFAEEEAESRIIGGLHFRWSTVAGSALGESVAKIALKNFATTP